MPQPNVPDATREGGQRRAWPSTVPEERPWRTNPDQRGTGGTRPNQADRMLDQITVEIPAEIGQLAVTLSATTIAVCEDARAHIAALEEAGGLAGLGDLLVRTESVASSRIERVDTDLDDFARATIGEETSESARRTMRAVHALSALASSCENGAPLTADAIENATLSGRS